jgi:hypothetical protein
LNPKQGIGSASEFVAELASEIGQTVSANLSLSLWQRFFKSFSSADVFKLSLLPTRKKDEFQQKLMKKKNDRLTL